MNYREVKEKCEIDSLVLFRRLEALEGCERDLEVRDGRTRTQYAASFLRRAIIDEF